ncbi:MAG: glycoside hydrolase family 32 protein, partial [Clostridia bacterium]|nr:glycoside hydrolase family 32 protein [Clostridia bacterium]
CFSGGAFVDDDKTAYLTFWKWLAADKSDNGGVALACAPPPYTHFERVGSVIIESETDKEMAPGIKDMVIDGELFHIACADPSNIWKQNGWYYLQTGNLQILDTFGRGEDAPEKYKGGWTELFRSKDLKNWEYVHRFYEIDHSGKDDWPDESEDDMCPSFLPLYDAKSGGKPTGKWLQLFISHNKGCQYFVGTLDGETFLPEKHGRMSWKDRAYFAPEALVDDKNRQIMWVWILDNPKDDGNRFGWSGVFSFPRCLWWEKGELHMAPVDEVERLQYNSQIFKQEDMKKPLSIQNGRSFRFKLRIDPMNEKQVGVSVLVDAVRGEETRIYVDRDADTLVIDTTNSGTEGSKIKEEAPFCLHEGECLDLDIFVDRSIVEVYANDRQAVCRRVYPTEPEKATGVIPIGLDNAHVFSAQMWEMAPTNPY